MGATVRRRPVRVHILTFPHSTPIVPVGLLDLLRKSTQLAASIGTARPVDVALVAASRRPQIEAAGPSSLRCRYSLVDAPRADIVVISPLDPEVLDASSRDRATIRFIRRSHAGGADVASVCTGAFALAETGLLDGKQAATHWAFQDLFRSRFPRVDLRPQHGDDAVLAAQALIERSVREAVSVERVASEVAMTRRTFARRFRNATGSTPREYQQRARVEAAKRVLEASRDTVAKVAVQVGYRDLVAFRRLFQRHTGLTPADYRRRYGRA